MKLKTTIFSTVLIAAVLGGGAYGMNWWEMRQVVVTTDNAYVRSDVTAISPRVAGYIETLHVTSNQHVTAGQPLVTLQADQYESDVDSARADLRAAEAEIEISRATIANMGARRALQQSRVRQAEARVEAARAQAEQAAREVERYSQLLDRGTGTRQKFEEATTHDRTMRAEVTRAQAEAAAERAELPVIDTDVLRIEREIDRLQAKVDRARSDLDRAEIALSDTVVVSPIDGVVGNLRVENGMYTEEGWPMLSVVPLQTTYVIANFKETQLERLRVGQEVHMEIDAFPGMMLVGYIDSLAPASAAEFSLLPPQNATGNFIKVVQRIPVKIFFDFPAGFAARLVPGMSVVVTVDTRSAPQGAALADEG
jgi:membrane fusion protein (multidrug efflux system)